jgi:hypothetical protein
VRGLDTYENPGLRRRLAQPYSKFYQCMPWGNDHRSFNIHQRNVLADSRSIAETHPYALWLGAPQENDTHQDGTLSLAKEKFTKCGIPCKSQRSTAVTELRPNMTCLPGTRSRGIGKRKARALEAGQRNELSLSSLGFRGGDMAFEALADRVVGLGWLVGSGRSMLCFVGFGLPPTLTTATCFYVTLSLWPSTQVSITEYNRAL